MKSKVLDRLDEKLRAMQDRFWGKNKPVFRDVIYLDEDGNPTSLGDEAVTKK